MLPAKTPDITPAQILSKLSLVVSLLLTQGLIDNNTEKLITAIAAIVVTLGWDVADAIIRHGRAKAVAEIASKDILGLAEQALERAGGYKRPLTADDLRDILSELAKDVQESHERDAVGTAPGSGDPGPQKSVRPPVPEDG